MCIYIKKLGSGGGGEGGDEKNPEVHEQMDSARAAHWAALGDVSLAERKGLP